MPQKKLIDTSNVSPFSSPSTPNTRKRHRDYAELENYGLQGRPASSPIPAARLQEKARKQAKLKTLDLALLSSQSQAATLDLDSEPDAPPIPKTKELEGSKKRAWFWQYYTSTVLDTTWERGKKGRKSITVQDEHHICNVSSNCRFQRFARNLHSSTTALKDHIEIDYKIFESTDPKSAYTANLILLKN
jgi:hypothetical protein